MEEKKEIIIELLEKLSSDGVDKILCYITNEYLNTSEC